MNAVAEALGGRSAPQARFPEIRQLLALIRKAYDPIDVVLYGSRARGEATAHSDWDLKVIVADDAPERLLSPLYGWKVQQGSGVHADVTCTRLSDFVEDLEVANSAASSLVADGIIIHVD
nr:nucleotidyltransferase domain-containing protein [uncultured Gellertiella sp.]